METKSKTEPAVWRIDRVDGDPNKTQLLNCTIFRDASGDYQFRGPRGNVRSTVIAPNNIPFNLPAFSAQLNGGIARSWYLRVISVNDSFIQGTWGNSGYNETAQVGGGGESDTWTAQAGVGVEVGDDTENDKEKTKEAAASASPKL